MSLFKQRSYQKELLDSQTIPFAAIKKNMQELDFINRKLGGHAITLRGIETLIKQGEVVSLHITEIGCGGGDNLRAIKTWADKIGLNVQLTGIDVNAECIAYAREQKRNNDIDFIHSDYKNVNFYTKPHIIFSSLFCHHFADEELIQMLQWMQANSQTGFFINDLHRHPLAFYSIKVLTQFFSKSYLVKNDAPLSVLRGFKREEWKQLFALAGIKNYKCQWRWAFRWLITSHS
jgi:2-polyprenyl-3-methyl-5-hydroxy-6-metoxy-1,4-benzoquinol methylase